MCCLFCVSFRGAAYFATTAQILIGLGIVIKYASSLLNLRLQDLQNLASGTVAIIFSYGILILIFGCCIFRSIEVQSLRGLKVAVGGLTLLQVLVLLTHLVLIALAFEEISEQDRMTQVSVLASNLVLTFLFITTLFLYMISLAKREMVHLRSCSGSSASSLPLSSTGGLVAKDSHYHHGGSLSNGGRYSVGSSTMTASSTGQRYVDGHWEDLHV